MKRIIITALAMLVLIGAAGVTVYPLVSNYVNDKYQSVVRLEYAQEMENLDAAAMEEAWEAGARHFGENYVQELTEKMQALSRPAQWHIVFIRLE